MDFCNHRRSGVPWLGRPLSTPTLRLLTFCDPPGIIIVSRPHTKRIDYQKLERWEENKAGLDSWQGSHQKTRNCPLTIMLHQFKPPLQLHSSRVCIIALEWREDIVCMVEWMCERLADDCTMHQGLLSHALAAKEKELERIQAEAREKERESESEKGFNAPPREQLRSGGAPTSTVSELSRSPSFLDPMQMIEQSTYA